MEPAYPFWLLLYTYATIHGDGDLPDPREFNKVPGGCECIQAICEEKGWVAFGGLCHWLPTARCFLEMCDGAPPLSVLVACPSNAFFKDGLDFLEGHIRWLEFQKENCWPDQIPYFDAWLDDARVLRNGYYAMDNGTNKQISYYQKYPAYQRTWLREAQNIFGAEALWTGTFPPPAPLHFFRKVP